MDKINCRTCGFDLASLQMTLPQPHADKRQAAGNRDIEVYCPVCGEKHLNLMKNKNFFLREKWSADGKREGAEWRYWVDQRGRTAGGGEQSGKVPIGELHILFGEQAKPIKVADIHFPVISRFVWGTAEGKKDALPLLPVKPDFIDCLDPAGLDALRRGDSELQPAIVEEGGKRFYRCIIPRRGASREQWIQDATKIELGPDIEGIFLRHWPNIGDLRWRPNLISLGFDDAKGVSELKSNWEMCVIWPRISRNDDQQLVEDESVFFSETVQVKDGGASGKRVFTVYSEGKDGLYQGRPAWVSLSSNGCGGLFGLPVPEPLGTTPMMEFGIDFGTSNTVIAAREDAGADGFSINTVKPGSDLTRWLFGHIDPKLDPDELWPGVPWTGGARDLLPSELVLREGKDWASVASDPATVNALKLGVDLAVPLMQAQPMRDPARSKIRPGSLLSDFKWMRAMTDRGLQMGLESLAAIQARYLEAGFLSAIAYKIKQSKQYPTRLNIRYSWPPAFDASDHAILASAMGSEVQVRDGVPTPSLRTRLTRLVTDGTNGEVVRGLDEATASAYAEDVNCRFLVFVDVGGGSVEVVIRDSQTDKKGPDRELDDVLMRRSIYFGGGVFLRSLVGDPARSGSSCTIAGVDYPTLAAQVRRYATGTELMSAPNLFSSTRLNTVRARARAYGEAISDLVARMIAGVCLEAGFYNQNVSLSDKPADWPPPLGRFDWKTKDSAVANISCNRLVTVKRVDDAPQLKLESELKFNIFLLGLGWNAVSIGVSSGTLESSFARSVQVRVATMLESERKAAELINDGNTSVFDLVSRGKLNLSCPPLDRRYEHRKAVVAKRLIEKADAGGALGDGVLSAPGVLGLNIVLGDRVIPWYRRISKDPDEIRRLKNQPNLLRIADKMHSEIVAQAAQSTAVPQSSVVPTGAYGTSVAPAPMYGINPTAPAVSQVPPPVPSSAGPPSFSASPAKDWHLTNAAKQPMGQWDFDSLVIELRKQPDRGRWFVWKPGFSGWQNVENVAELWPTLQPKILWSVAFGSTVLGNNLDTAAALAAIQGTPDARICKVWCSEFGPVWKSVSEVPELSPAFSMPPPLP